MRMSLAKSARRALAKATMPMPTMTAKAIM